MLFIKFISGEEIMKNRKIISASVPCFLILLCTSVFAVTPIIESEKNNQYIVREFIRKGKAIYPVGLDEDKLASIQKEQWDKPPYKIWFYDASGEIYHSCSAEGLVLEKDVYNGELYTLEADVTPNYITRKTRAISEGKHSGDFIEAVDLYIRKYAPAQNDGINILKIENPDKPFDDFRKSVQVLVILNNQARILDYNPHYDHPEKRNFKLITYELNGSGKPISSLKIPVQQPVPSYNSHDDNYLYFNNSIGSSPEGRICQFIRIDMETGNKEILIEGTGKFTGFSKYKNDKIVKTHGFFDSRKNGFVQFFDIIDLKEPDNVIDRVTYSSLISSTPVRMDWDKELEKFIASKPGRDKEGNFFKVFYTLERK